MNEELGEGRYGFIESRTLNTNSIGIWKSTPVINFSIPKGFKIENLETQFW